ncbi:hypothetical protein ACFQE5_01840 [Pseudonocardia hispaniensis]|uniref:Tail terminator n=1 Tax=Pseudonocardia hispaniensis TaxID=904933 RepID=A0ABW1IXJ3_9PSEU
MTVPVRGMPDVEAMLVEWLYGQLGGVDVRTDLYVGFEDRLPLVQVVRIGGGMSHNAILIEPRLDIDVYAATRVAASDLAHQIEALMPAMRNIAVAGGLVTKVIEEIGPSYRPDVNPHTYRFGMTYQLVIRPA